jgi:uncharacterized protein (DUF1778 family)
MVKRESSTARLEARLPKSVLELIKKAAAIEGRSVSDFVVGSARQAAFESIELHAKLQLTLADQTNFAKAILNPKPPSAILKKAAARHRELIDSSRSQ